MLRKMLVSFWLALALPSGLAAQEIVQSSATIYLEANTAYEEGEWDVALERYERLLERGVQHADLYFNLGNTLLRRGELGRAIASYRRSLDLDPRHRDALANLQFARRSAKDALAPPGASTVVKTLFFWHYSFGRVELLAATMAVNFLFWLLLILLLFRRRSEVLRWSAILSFLVLLVVGTSTAIHYLTPARVAVVLPQEVEARAGTRPGAVVRFRLHAGSELRVVEIRGDWVRIALPDGEEAWIELGNAEIV